MTNPLPPEFLNLVDDTMDEVMDIRVRQGSTQSGMEIRAQQSAERAQLRRVVDWGVDVGEIAVDEGVPTDVRIMPIPDPTQKQRRFRKTPEPTGREGWLLIEATKHNPVGLVLTADDEHELIMFKTTRDDMKALKKRQEDEARGVPVGMRTVQDAVNPEYQDGMGTQKTLELGAACYPLPQAVSRLRVQIEMGAPLGTGLSAIEASLVRFVVTNGLDS